LEGGKWSRKQAGQGAAFGKERGRVKDRGGTTGYSHSRLNETG